MTKNKAKLLILSLIVAASVFNFARAGESLDKTVNATLFYSPTCEHCLHERIFWKEWLKTHSGFHLEELNIYHNQEKLKEYYHSFNVPRTQQGLVPIVFIKDRYFVGFNDNIKKEIENYLNTLLKSSPPTESNFTSTSTPNPNQQIINLPLLGKINPKNYSLPVLSALLGFFDGFNVCSLGALVFILGLVLGMKNRKAILAVGGGYILITAIVYGILIHIWYEVFSLLSRLARLLEIIVGTVGIGGSIYFFREFLKARKGTLVCESQSQSVFKKLSQKTKQAFTEKNKNILLILFSVIIFAAAVTVIEFPCSAAIPLLYAGILVKASLSLPAYLFNLAIYLILYMADEIAVFLGAFFTMRLILASPKNTRWLTLAESIILLLLGLYYLIGLGIFVK